MKFRLPTRLDWLLLAMAAAAAVLPARAQPAGEGGYAGPEWKLLDRAAELRAAATVTPQRFPNCDSVTVDERVEESYRPDGSALQQDETYTKILTEKGRQDNAIISQGFLLPYFVVGVQTLELIKADGRVVPVNVGANSSVSIDDSQMAENIYDPNSRVLKVNVPGLEVGDVLHSVMRTVTRRAIIAGAFADQFLFEGPDYILHTSCEIRTPAGLPLRSVRLRDPVAGTVRHTREAAPGGGSIERWEVSDVPRMYDEPAMPPYEMVLQRVLVSTLPQWTDVSKWYWDLSRPHLAATTPAMSELVARLTARARSDQDKIDALFYYVSRDIRYMGVTPEKDRPGFEPHDVSLTFEKRYGVCRDKAALLVALLRMAGEKAYPVLINVGTKLDPKVPSPDFNHAIVAVENSPGRYQLMDPTDEHTRGLLPAYDDDQSYLVCRPEGDDLRTSPVEPPDENMMRIRTTARLEADGTLTGTSELDFEGINDDMYRGALVEMTADKRLRFFERTLQRALPGARVISLRLEPADLLDASQPLRAWMDFSVGSMAAFGSGESIVTLPWLGLRFGLLNYVLDDTGLAVRRYPLIIPATCGVEEEMSVRLAPNFRAPISVPADASSAIGAASYRRIYSADGPVLAASRRFTLNTVEFSPEQYAGLKGLLAQVAYDDRREPMAALVGPPPSGPAQAAALAPSPAGADAEVLEDNQDLRVVDAHTATLRVSYVKRVLTYEGKITESEVKLPYNPSTEQVRLLHAYVVSPGGQRQKESLDEINTMDAGWNSSAKRYTGGKILVDSLPGVEIGSLIHVEFEVRTHDAPLIASFQPFQLTQPLDRKSFTLEAPMGVPVHERVSGEAGVISESIGTKGGEHLFAWRAAGVPALPDESSAPPPWSFAPGVSYSIGAPADFVAALNRAMLARSRPTPELEALARRLTAGAHSRLEALRDIRDFVARTIRLAGPSFTELPLSELSPAAVTLADGYGDLADRAILLSALLSADGFNPRFVLASDVPPVRGLRQAAEAPPIVADFDTPLVRVAVGNDDYYLNDTDQYAPLGATPHDDRLAIGLSSGEYEIIRALGPERARDDITYAVSLFDGGAATIRIVRDYYGTSFAAENWNLAQMRPEEKARYFQELVSAVAQDAKPVGGLATDFDTYPGRESFTVKVDHYAVSDGRFLYFDLPGAPRFLPASGDLRVLPLLDKDDRREEVRVELSLPPGYSHLLIAPRARSLTAPDGAGTAVITSQFGHGRWLLTYRLDREPAVITPGDYPKALAEEASLENRAADVVLLARPAGLAGQARAGRRVN